MTFQQIGILRFRLNKKKERIKDYVVQEIKLDIHLNGKEFASLMCLPDKLKELGVGFLISEGIIKDIEDIKNIKMDKSKSIISIKTNNRVSVQQNKKTNSITILSGCGSSSTSQDLEIPADCKKINTEKKLQFRNILELMKKFLKKGDVFAKTGAVHSATVSDGDSFILFAEDIGRHNAIDKIIGEAFLKKVDLKDKILFCTGRISSDMIFKTIRQKIPMVVSNAAPTYFAVRLAEKFLVTLIGFTRGNRMNLYTHPERID